MGPVATRSAELPRLWSRLACPLNWCRCSCCLLMPSWTRPPSQPSWPLVRWWGWNTCPKQVELLLGQPSAAAGACRVQGVPNSRCAQPCLPPVMVPDARTAGHSRIPVHRPGDRSAILGIMLVKASGSWPAGISPFPCQVLFISSRTQPIWRSPCQATGCAHACLPAPLPAHPLQELLMVDKDQGRTVGQMKVRTMPAVRAGEPGQRPERSLLHHTAGTCTLLA